MALSVGYPPIPGDPGGGIPNYFDGTYTGATLPNYMDPQRNHGELIVLRMEPVNGKMPDHPFLLRQSIEKRVNGKIEGAISEAQGRAYALKVRSQHHLDRLLSMTQLNDGTAVKVTHHPGLNSVRCVISCRDLINVKSDEDLLNCLKDQKVTGVRRISRKVGDGTEPTATVILTVSGTTRPDHIDVGYQRIRTRPYYPAPMLCYKCYQFGHTRQRCQQQSETCGNCGEQHEIVKGVKCPSPAYCTRCKNGNHSVGSRTCPVYKKEDAIQHIRVDRGLTYPEARRLFEANNGQRSFAGITAYSKDQTIAMWSAKFEALAAQMAEKDARIKALEEEKTADTNTNKSDEFQILKDQIDSLKIELKKKDKRIQMLEDANKKDSRLDKVRKHGTIEDLVARVSALESSSAQKDEEILTLRKENEAYRKLLGNKILPKPPRNQAAKEKITPTPQKGSLKGLKPRNKTPVRAVKTPMELDKAIEVTTPTKPDKLSPPESQTYTGTKPKTKMPLTEQISTEAKGVKGTQSPMYISDTEEEQSQSNITAIVTDMNIDISGDEVEGSDPLSQDL